MTQLMNVLEQDGVQVVSARELHEFLEVGKDFSTWIKQEIEKYGFTKEVDYSTFSPELGNTGGRPRTEFIISLDMAKELSMVQRTEKGKQARQYFIACEKELRKVVSTYRVPTTYVEALEALVLSEKNNEALRLELESDKHKVEFYETIHNSERFYNVTEIAKKFGLRAQEVNVLLHEKGIQMKIGKT